MTLDLSEIDVILLDQGETFMFANDRFGPDENFSDTYRRIGGTLLADSEVNAVISYVLESLITSYDSGLQDDRFPTVGDILMSSDRCLPGQEVALLDDVVAEHEIGTISQTHRDTIHRLHETHRLGIISNIFAQRGRFEHNLQTAGIFDCFEHIVWSSAHGMIKPSAKLFQIAIDHWGLEPARMLYVGNDARRDVGGSKGVGMKTAWINLLGVDLPSGIAAPDTELSDLAELSVV